jgi:hypothetical protein
MADVGLRTVAELMGHKTIQMTMRYAHLAPEHNLAAVERLNSYSSFNSYPGVSFQGGSPPSVAAATEDPTDTTTDTPPKGEASIARESVQ